jgi:hypothetical protein
MKAERVVVYLGPATAATDQSMDYLMQIEKQEGMPQVHLTDKLSKISDRDGDLKFKGF